MNILNKLTKNSLKLNHKRTLVTCIGIILSTALICAVAGMVTSFQQTLIVATKKTEGNYHVRFENVLKDDLTYIEKNDKVKSYFLTNNIGYSEVKSKNDNKPYVYVIGFSNDALNNMGLTLEEGKFPSNNNEIVIPSHLINNGEVNLKIGDKLVLTSRAKKSGEDALSRILRVKDDIFTFIGMAGGTIRIKDSKGDTYILSSTRFASTP